MRTPIANRRFSTMISRKRPTGGVWNSDGRWVPSAGTSTTSILASVQPTSNRDKQTLPEGMRERAAVTVYSESELRELSQKDGHEPDVIVWEGDDYEVFESRHWTQLMPHWKAICVRKESEGT